MPDVDPARLVQQPALRRGTAQATALDRLFIGHELTGRVAALDPVASIIVAAFDGTTPLTTLVADVATSAGIDDDSAAAYLLSIIDGLDDGGFLEGWLPDVPNPRRIDVAVPPDSCLGERWGLSRSTQVQVAGNDGFRISSTAPEVIDGIAAVLEPLGELTEVDDEPMDTLHLRASVGPRRRVQQLFDTLDLRYFVGRDVDVAVEAFHRTIAARLALRAGGAWLQGPSVEADGKVVLIHPSLWDRCCERPVRGRLADAGVTFTPTGLLRCDGDTLGVTADPFGDRPSRSLRPVGVVTPVPWDDVEHVRQCLHLLRWWDRTGFRALVSLAPSLPELAADTDDGIAAAILSALA